MPLTTSTAHHDKITNMPTADLPIIHYKVCRRSRHFLLYEGKAEGGTSSPSSPHRWKEESEAGSDSFFRGGEMGGRQKWRFN